MDNITEKDSKAATVSPMFDNPNADITFCSQDGIHFKLQRKYLEANTGAFPGPEFDTLGEVVYLQEPAAVLTVLFGMTTPQAQPDVEELDFKLLDRVAEAAEKYEAFFAVSICRLQMRQFKTTYPLEILAYATRHDYPKLIAEVAPALVRHPVLEVVEQLPSKYIIPWLQHREEWDAIFEWATKYILVLQVATSPRVTHQRSSYFSQSVQGQACHSCILAMLKNVQALKDIQSLDELDKTLRKTYPPLMSSCIASSCQYTIVMSKLCTEMLAKIESMEPFALPRSSPVQR